MNDLPPGLSTAPVCLRLHGPLGPETLEGAREWLLRALQQHPDEPIVLELGPLPAADDAAMQLLVDTARALRQAGRALRLEADPPGDEPAD